MPKNFSVDDVLYRAQAKKLVRLLKLDEPKFVRDQTGMLAQSLASVTPPFVSFGRPKLNYGSKKDILQGHKATRAGFYSIVKLMTKEQNWKDKNIKEAIQRGDMAYLEARLKHYRRSKKRNMKVREYSDNLRNKQRDSRGRTSRNATPFVVISKSDANRGLEQALGRVGMAKAVLAKAAVRLGRKKPIKDIFKHFGKVQATVTVTKNPATAGFTVKSHGLDVTQRRLKDVEMFRLKGMVSKLKKDLRRQIKKAGFQTR